MQRRSERPRSSASAREVRASVLAALGVLAGLLAWSSPAAATVPAPPPGSPAVESAPASLVGLDPTVPASVLAASSAPGSHWAPQPAVYGTASINDIPVRGAGGTTIRVDEIYPTLADGAPAPGPFPVLLTMTPYGKGQGGSSAPGSAAEPSNGSPTGGPNDYLVERGFIDVVMDVRGTGDSGGQWGLFDPIQQADAIKVVDWCAHLPHADGKVGTYGPSYLGIDQLLLAGAIGPHSPLKAIFPMVAANDIYRDTAFMGGLVDFEFSELYLGLTGALNEANPVVDTASDPALLADLAGIELDHTSGLASYHAATEANVLGGRSEAYDGTYWQLRNPANVLARIVANGIPAYLVGGEFDLFQNGEPLNYAGLQNAYDHRPVGAPMLPNQPVTGRYQLLDGPWEHLNGSSLDVDELELEWFDTWLKGEHTGMAETPTPLHYYDLGTGTWDETTTYPFAGAHPTTFTFRPGGVLAPGRPPVHATPRRIVWSPSGSPCGRPIDQWAMGGISVPAQTIGVLPPCADADNTTQIGPWAATWTTPPLTSPLTIAGPIEATVVAAATTPETELVAEVEEVTPNGTSFPLTEGALLGSLRAVNPQRSWVLGGTMLYPYHPSTEASARPVVPGKLTTYDIQIFPTFVTIARGDRLRVTIATTDTPHLVPLLEQLPELAGGVYAISQDAAAPSSLSVDVLPHAP
jgi:putative CocE/NonD family hydrolase